MFFTLSKGARTTDFLEPGFIRRHLLDTFLLRGGDAKVVARWLDLPMPSSDVYGANDGFRYDWQIQGHHFSIFGIPEDGELQTMNAFVTSEIENRFSKIDIDKELISISLINSSSRDTLYLFGKGPSLRASRNSMTKQISSDRYFEFRRILENNQVWNLQPNRILEKRNPMAYFFRIENQEQQNEWFVFGPSHLEDKRYFEILSSMENLFQ